MHRIDGLDHVLNMFDEGDPLVPREATQVTVDWLNAVQEEAVAIVLDPDSGLALDKPTNTQIRAALRVLFVRAKGAAAQSIDGLKTFTAKLTVQVAAGVAQLLETTENVLAAQQVRNFGAGGGVDASGLAYGVKGTATGGGAVGGVEGDGQSGGGSYGVVARGKQIGPARAALRIVPQDNPPSAPLDGDLYVATSTGKLMIAVGGAWVVVGTQS